MNKHILFVGKAIPVLVKNFSQYREEGIQCERLQVNEPHTQGAEGT